MYSGCNVTDNHCVPCILLLLAKRAIDQVCNETYVNTHVTKSEDNSVAYFDCIATFATAEIPIRTELISAL